MTYGVPAMVTLIMVLRVGPFSLTILILDVWTISPTGSSLGCEAL